MKTYKGFHDGQADYSPGSEYACVLQDPESHSLEETRKTARAVLHVDPETLVFVKGHVGGDKGGHAYAPVFWFQRRGYMVFARKDHPEIRRLLA